MPIIQSTYTKPWYMFHPHVETVYPNRFRPAPSHAYMRERMELADGDFMDLDWLKQGQKRLVILAHGLEGDSDRPYMRAMAQAFVEAEWDVACWNCRSCSGEINRNYCLYHHGVSEDLAAVVAHVESVASYDEIALVGFSMGGAIILKYLGERGAEVPSQIKAAVAISTPCHLPDSVAATQAKGNKLYVDYFLKNLGKKVQAKAAQFPNKIDAHALASVKTLWDFADQFSAPMYGYASGRDFFEDISAITHLPHISTPTLILNAENDPMLEGLCYPVKMAQNHPYLHLEMPAVGGHVGFLQAGNRSYAELRAMVFANQFATNPKSRVHP